MAENSVRRVARLGYHLAGSGGADLQQFYDDELNTLGQKIEEHSVSQLRAVYVAETREKAWDDCEQHLHYMMSLYDKRYKEADDMRWGQEVMSAPIVPIGNYDTIKTCLFSKPLLSSVLRKTRYLKLNAIYPKPDAPIYACGCRWPVCLLKSSKLHVSFCKRSDASL